MGLNVVTTCEPENLKTVLALNFSDYNLHQLRKKGLDPIFGKGIFTTDGAEWEHSRAMLRPNFTRSQVGDLATFETHVSHLIDAIPPDGSPVDLQDLFFDLTLDSATEFLFGESANSLLSRAEPPGHVSFGEAFTYCTTNIGSRLRFGLLLCLPDKQFEKCRKAVLDFADRYAQKALMHYRLGQSEKASAKPGERYIFLHELVKQTQDPVALRSETMNILLAGRDTTASLLSNLWNVISKRPDVWAKLQAEVAELNGKKPSFEEIKSMKYLRHCLNECLRLFPVVPSNSRVAVRDTILPLGGGPDGKSPVFVTKGTTLSYYPYTMHRREDLYGPDAAEFRPERWETLRPGWEYLPFNGGPRICLGQQFALTEASYTTIRMLQTFRTIESRDPEPWVEFLTLTCTSGHGAKVALRRC
jgi:cytochrome P450